MSDEPVLRDAMASEAKRLIIDCTYSGRRHQHVGHRWAGLNTWLGVPIVIASALTASGAGISALIGQNSYLKAGLALFSAVLTATRAFFRPAELAGEHGLKGDRFTSLRNEARFFVEVDLRSSLGEEEFVARLRDLRDRYNALNETSPRRIPRNDYGQARRSIARGEVSY